MSTPPQEPGEQQPGTHQPGGQQPEGHQPGPQQSGPQQPHQPPQHGTPPQHQLQPPAAGQWQGGQQAPPAGQWQGGQQAPAAGQWQSGQQGSGAPSGGSAEAIDAKGFFTALFDWKFHTLITPKIVSIVYLIGMVLIGLSWLAFLVQGFAADPLIGLFVLLIGPIIAIVYLAFWRMTLEFYFAVVRMSDDIHRSGNAPRR